MDRQKYYIIALVITIIAAAGIWYFSNQDQSTATLPQGVAPITTDIDAPSASLNAGDLPTADQVPQYAAPRVFPNDTKLDLSVYNSTQFQNLSDYAPLTVPPEQIGRENPFQAY